ncbi:ATPase [Rhodocytophaga rosea]|uniref:ATPase n=1 Tax=Rhodocytophaga rosea TaxID=2704465 RepID=A0A6C0GXP0_9BACT|nr:SRPBCC domain-containing protein [Rhodocytophaga rosea]QHT72190.1 ATPase [Rhodocytophaga rosea]
MKRKTNVHAEDGKQDLVITREFDLPLELLFKAYVEPHIIEQWMGTKVLKLENKKHGSWEFETSNPQGNVAFVAHGVIHEFSPKQKITRTFEMENAPFGVQLEFLEFEAITSDTSKLTMHIVYKSVAHRDQMLQLPFAQGINMAHNRLQDIVSQLTKHSYDQAK